MRSAARSWPSSVIVSRSDVPSEVGKDVAKLGDAASAARGSAMSELLSPAVRAGLAKVIVGGEPCTYLLAVFVMAGGGAGGGGRGGPGEGRGAAFRDPRPRR